MRKSSRIILLIGMALLCVALAVYVKKKNANARAVSQHKVELIAEEKEKQRQAKMERDWFYSEIDRSEIYYVRRVRALAEGEQPQRC